MPEEPIAKLALDTRAHGEYLCENCDEPLENAILMTDASVVCPECKKPLKAFQAFTDAIVSASPVGKASKGQKGGKWVIELSNIDSSRNITRAYNSREDALEVAANWAKEMAKHELDQFEWDEGDEAPEDLKAIILAAESADYLDAVQKWLDYQGDYDPGETMALGPSGSVTDNSSELS